MTSEPSLRGPILCAFDASEPSLLAAHAAAWLAATVGAPLELVWVVDPDDLPALPSHGAGIDPYVRDALPEIQEQIAADEARAELEATLAELDHVDVSGKVLSGWPATMIRRRAIDSDAALLVTGTSMRRGLDRLLWGSVAGALAADSPCPVVVVPPDAAVGEPGPVLICDDGSEYARRAEAHAQALSARLGRGVDRVAVETGDPVEQIAAAAAERRACVVVAGTRGRSQLTWRVFGSVCEGLVRAAGRPVMLVSAHAHEPA